MNVKDVIKSRRAYRSLEKTGISRELILDLAESAMLSASCFNKQPWRYVFAHESEALNKVKDALSAGNEWAREASMIIAVCSKKEFDCIMPDGREYYLFDAGMSSAFLILRATELGLVAHPIAGYDQKKVKEALNIPDDVLVITLIIVAKHSAEIKPVLNQQQIDAEKTRPQRMPAEKIVFFNKYGK